MWNKCINYINNLTKNSHFEEKLKSVKTLTLSKQKKIAFFLSLSGIAVISAFYITFKPVPAPVLKKQDTSILVPLEGDDLKHWTVQNGVTLDHVKKKLQEHEQDSKESKKQITELNAIIDKQKLQMAALQEWFNKSSTETNINLTQFREQVTNELHRQESRSNELAGTLQNANSNTVNQNDPAEGAVSSDNLEVFTPPTEKKDAAPTQDSVKNPYHGYLPVGSFFTATLLNGINAPTGSVGVLNPAPILMKVMADAILPNDKYRYKLKGCFIMGTAFGSVSSERVTIKLSRLSCINQDGTAAVIAEIRGFVVDSDGIGDLRGKFENRQGSKIALATLSGFAQGIGNMFGNAQGTTVISPSGTGISMDTNQKLSAAGFNGLGEAANIVAQFYIKQAEQIYPVIVIQTGRTVTINIQEGVTLHWTNINDSHIPSNKLKDNPSNESASLKEDAV